MIVPAPDGAFFRGRGLVGEVRVVEGNASCRSGSRLVSMGLSLLGVAALLASVIVWLPAQPAGAAGAPAGLHVSGNRLLDGSGTAIVLHGVDRSGTEYACIQGFGFFDGPSDATSIAAMAGWHINAVRVPLKRGLLARDQQRAVRLLRQRLPVGDRGLRSPFARGGTRRHPRPALDGGRYRPVHRPAGHARCRSRTRVLDLGRDRVQG